MSSTVLLGYVDRHGDFAVAPTLRVADPLVGRLAFAAPHGDRRFGFLHRDGHWAVEPTLSWFGSWSAGEDRIATVNVGGERGDRGITGGRWGIVGGDGMLVAPRFEGVGTPSDEAVPFLEGGRWGLVSRDGEVLVAPRFEWLGALGDGVAVACENGRDGYLGFDGTWALEPRFDQAMASSAGLGRVKTERGWVLVDREGRERGEGFDEIWAFVDGQARVKRGERFTVIGPDGAPLCDRWFDEVGGYHQGLAPCRDGDDWFFVDATGGVHGPYANALTCTGGLARFIPHGGDVGFLRPDGTVAIAPSFQSAGGFVSGRAPVKRDGRWTYVREDGTEVAPPTFDDARAFPDDGTPLAVVRQGDRFGAVDLDGNLVVEPRFDTLGLFAGGLAPARRVGWPTALPAPRPEITTMPREGLAHPAIAELGAEGDLRLLIGFSPELTHDQLARLQEVVWSWHQVMDARAGRAALVGGNPWIASYGLALRLTGVSRPALAVALLVEDLLAMGLPVQEVDFLPLRADPEEPPQWQIFHQYLPAVPDPADPRGPLSFPDFEAYWQAMWDEAGAPPRSENPMYLLAGRWDQRAGKLRYAERLLTLHQPGLRIGYGVFQGGFTETSDDRAEAVASAIERALAEVFDRDRIWVFPGNQGWRPPVPMRRDWSTGVETITYDGRRGYYFAIDCPPLLQDVGPDAFRYRENELMEAMAAVVQAEGLAPVVLWQRFGDPLPGPSMAGVPHPMNPTFLLIELWEA